MERRTLLRRLAAVVTGGLAAGCTSAGEVPVTAPPGPEELPDTKTDLRDENGDGGQTAVPNPLVSKDWRFYAGEDGMLVISVTVSNDGPVPRTAPVEVVASTENEGWTKRRYVTLGPHESTKLTFEFPVKYRTFNTSEPSIRINFPNKTPETAIPDETSDSPSDSPTDSSDADGSATGTTRDSSPTGTETGTSTGTD